MNENVKAISDMATIKTIAASYRKAKNIYSELLEWSFKDAHIESILEQYVDKRLRVTKYDYWDKRNVVFDGTLKSFQGPSFDDSGFIELELADWKADDGEEGFEASEMMDIEDIIDIEFIND
jgi:hypothetical protein